MTRRGGSRVLVLLALINFVSYAARNGLFGVYPALQDKFGIGYDDIGLLTTMFMVPHAAATLLFGWAGDRFDRRRVIAAGMILASVAGAVGALSTGFWSLAGSRALVGFGTAAVVPVANSILAQIYEGPTKGSRIALFNLGLFLGGVAGFFAGQAFGFPLVLVMIAMPGAALAVAFLIAPVPPHAAPQTGKLADFARQLVRDAGVLLRIRTLRWLILSTITMAFAAGGYNAWLQVFLVKSKGMSPGAANSLLAIALVGGLAGVLTGARISDALRTKVATGRLRTIIAGMACTVPCAVAAILMPAGPLLFAIGALTMFFISWYHAPMAASVDDLAPPHLTVAAQGLVIFTMHMFGTSPSSYVVGIVADQTTLQTAMWVPTASLLVAALCMIVATGSFAADQARARGGGSPVASL